MIRRPPRSTLSSSSAASDVYKRQCPLTGVIGYNCTTDCGSRAGDPVGDFGFLTGDCMGAPGDTWCQVRGWCCNGQLPADPDPATTGCVVKGPDAWSLFLRLNVAFPSLGVQINTGDHGFEPGVNQWFLGEVLAGANLTYDEVAPYGAVVLMHAIFNCTFDQTPYRCHPRWEFSRLDTGIFSRGNSWRERVLDPANVSFRKVEKRYGIRFKVLVSGCGKLQVA
eukprot:TRINITY_DN19177_c0_g1_i1.p1 TRINITY_DN19177_c0_g1~~TRINITY_DN19177_c0_g1_i1.p1  ORF type:complete len:223 (+),score=33.81 TRINITY_DN19177_c0_g1_i1:64-732(+)